MFVCICQAVTDKQIRSAASAGVHTLDDLGDVLGVATCCGGCGPEAEALLDEVRQGQALALAHDAMLGDKLCA